MSGYNMASLHTKHSKQLNLPLGSRWGIPEGTSVADCLNWTWSNKPAQPPPPPTPEPQLVLEEKTMNEVYVSPTAVDLRTPVPPAEPTSKQINGTVSRSKPTSTCSQSRKEWVVAASRLNIKNRPATPAELHVKSEREALPQTLGDAIYAATLDSTPAVETTYRKPNNEIYVPQGTIVKTVYNVPKERELSATPVTLQRYFEEMKQTKATSGRKTPQRFDKFGSYPQYRPESADNVDLIVKKTRSLKVCTPTPMRPSSRSGNISRAELLKPRTEEDDAKENAVIEAFRKELRSRGGTVQPQTYVTRPPSVRPTSCRAVSRGPSRSGSRSQRPKSSSGSQQLELMREKKTVGFIDENEYYRYLTYLEDKYGGDTFRSGRPGSSYRCSEHFKDWRGTTERVRKDKPVPIEGWKSPGSSAAGKVNVAMDCPENSGMTINLTVRNTPTKHMY